MTAVDVSDIDNVYEGLFKESDPEFERLLAEEAEIEAGIGRYAPEFNPLDLVDECKPRMMPFKYIRPFVDNASELIDICSSTEGRWFFGIKPLDDMMRGIGRGQLCYVSARAHSGKTVLLLNSIVNNPGARVLIFTPDETGVEILAKLVSMVRGIDGEELERRIKAGDEKAIDAVIRTARDDFKNLIVIDDGLSFDQMTVALKEAETLWGAPADLVAVDYLELLGGDGEMDGVSALSKEMKRWTKASMRPVMCLRQNSRTSSKRGQAAGMDGMGYAGQNEAIYVIEVYRRREDESLTEHERDMHRDSITVNLAKNKRPPCRRGELELHMVPATGIVRVPQPGDTGYVIRGPVDALQTHQVRMGASDDSF